MKTVKQECKPRNPFHDHPLMRKGGVHEKTNKAKRKGEKQKLKKEWCSLMLFKQVTLKNTTQRVGSLIGKAFDCGSSRCGFESGRST